MLCLGVECMYVFKFKFKCVWVYCLKVFNVFVRLMGGRVMTYYLKYWKKKKKKEIVKGGLINVKAEYLRDNSIRKEVQTGRGSRTMDYDYNYINHISGE